MDLRNRQWSKVKGLGERKKGLLNKLARRGDQSHYTACKVFHFGILERIKIALEKKLGED